MGSGLNRAPDTHLMQIRVPTEQTATVYRTVQEVGGTISYITSYWYGQEAWDELAVDLGSLPAVAQRLDGGATAAGVIPVFGQWDADDASNLARDDERRRTAEHRGAIAMFTAMQVDSEESP